MLCYLENYWKNVGKLLLTFFEVCIFASLITLFLLSLLGLFIILTIFDISFGNYSNGQINNNPGDQGGQSNNNVVIFGNTKTDKAHKLTFNGDYKPKDKEEHTITLKINDAKPNSQYKLCLYAREKIDGPDLSKPLNIFGKCFSANILVLLHCSHCKNLL